MILGFKNLVELLLQRPSIDLTKKNNDNKTAYDLVRSDDIKSIFSIYISEKSMLETKYAQRIHIHHTKNDQIKKMFENTGFEGHFKVNTPNKKSNESVESDTKVNKYIAHIFEN